VCFFGLDVSTGVKTACIMRINKIYRVVHRNYCERILIIEHYFFSSYLIIEDGKITAEHFNNSQITAEHFNNSQITVEHFNNSQITVENKIIYCFNRKFSGPPCM